VNFIDYIKPKIKNQEPKKNIYGKTIANYYYLENLKFEEKTTITELKNLNFDFYKDKNQLDVNFELLYKGYTLATDVSLELFEPFQFDFIVNAERTSNIKTATKKLKAYYNTIFKFEISSNNLIIQAKNEDLNFQLKTQFKKVNLDIEFVNTMAFIDALEKRPKHTKLFNSLCEIITDEQLDIISKADYGYKAEECFIVLKQMQETQMLPKEISFSVAEVLSLTRYSRAKTIEDHQEIVFVCAVVLLGNYEDQYTMLDNTENFLSSMFLSVTKLDYFFVTQARAFFVEKLATVTAYNIQTYVYFIAGFDLLLKEEENFKNSFRYLVKLDILSNMDFEGDTVGTAKKVEKATLLMLDNLDFITDKTLKKETKNLFTKIVCQCKERYDLKAIKSLYNRTFTKEQEKEYVQLIPELLNQEYNNRSKYLINKGLTPQQVEIITRSMVNASCFLDGSDYEMELKKNIFFDTYISLKKK